MSQGKRVNGPRSSRQRARIAVFGNRFDEYSFIHWDETFEYLESREWSGRMLALKFRILRAITQVVVNILPPWSWRTSSSIYLAIALIDNEASSKASNLVHATRDNLQYLREQCLQKGSVISNQVLSDAEQDTEHDFKQRCSTMPKVVLVLESHWWVIEQ